MINCTYCIYLLVFTYLINAQVLNLNILLTLQLYYTLCMYVYINYHDSYFCSVVLYDLQKAWEI